MTGAAGPYKHIKNIFGFLWFQHQQQPKSTSRGWGGGQEIILRWNRWGGVRTTSSPAQVPSIFFFRGEQSISHIEQLRYLIITRSDDGLPRVSFTAVFLKRVLYYIRSVPPFITHSILFIYYITWCWIQIYSLKKNGKSKLTSCGQELMIVVATKQIRALKIKDSPLLMAFVMFKWADKYLKEINGKKKQMTGTGRETIHNR